MFNGKVDFVLCYVSAVFETTGIIELITNIKRKLVHLLRVYDLEEVVNYLEINLFREHDEAILLPQQKYVEKIVDEIEFSAHLASRVNFDAEEDLGAPILLKAAVE